MELLGTALSLGAAGYFVFPCLASKNPATPNGFYDAATDEAAITNLWRVHPGSLIGVRAGLGFDALDLDPQARGWYEQNRCRLPQTRVHRTRRGGLHVLFQHDDAVRCTASKITAGVDTRGNGGYLIWWPATGLPVLSDAPLAPWPDWLLNELRPKPRPSASASASNIIRIGGDGWLRGLIRAVATAPEGQRNCILFWAACRAGEAVRDGKATEDLVTSVLLEAANHAGLTLREAQQTIRSGIQRV
jgi:Bifunctional DNA primase/polymerase, N-terminal